MGVPVQQITTQMPLPMNQLSSVHPHAAQVHLQQAQHHVPVAYHMALPEPSKPAAVATPVLAVTKTERKRKNKANREKVRRAKMNDRFDALAALVCPKGKPKAEDAKPKAEDDGDDEGHSRAGEQLPLRTCGGRFPE